MNSSPKYKPKLVVCLSRFPFPLEKGDKLRAFYQIKSLSTNFDVFLICTTDKVVSKDNLSKLTPYCKEIHFFKLNKIGIIFNLFFAIFESKPFQVAYFTQSWIKRKINKLLGEIEPDHIYCQLVRPAEYVKNYHFCNKTIDIMDALSKGMERRSAQSGFFYKFIFKEESKRLKKYERQILNYFEKSLIISTQDKNFILFPKEKETIVIANGVGEDFYRCNFVFKKEFDLVFTGNMSYNPNIEAANFIAKKMLPELLKINPSFKVLISGSNPSTKLKNLQNKHFFVSGWVDDIRESYLKSKIFIAPMFSGTGMQNKILEAMALGIPCITTSLVNNAILAKNNEEIVIAENLNQMLEAIYILTNNLDFYKMIAENGREFIKNNYQWEAINSKLLNLINDDIKTK